jgi:hypothetical protein
MQNLKPLPQARAPFYESYDKLFELRDALKIDAELFAIVVKIQKQMDELKNELDTKYLWDGKSAAIENLAA